MTIIWHERLLYSLLQYFRVCLRSKEFYKIACVPNSDHLKVKEMIVICDCSSTLCICLLRLDKWMCTYVVNVISAEAGPVSDSGLERISVSG